MVERFFTTDDPLEQIIAETMGDRRVLGMEHILTGWTNIVIEVTTDAGAFFFRFPRNPFWSKMIVKDACVCNFVEGKTSFYTPQMKLCYDRERRPFSVHQKIEGYTLGDRIYHLSHTALTGVAYDVAKFIKELSAISLREAPAKVKYPLSKFLRELDYKHYAEHIDEDHEFIKETETGNLVHGDLNLGNVLLDANDKVIGVIDFCFAGTGNPNMDVARILSRPVPQEFEEAFLAEFQEGLDGDEALVRQAEGGGLGTGGCRAGEKLRMNEEIARMKTAWAHIDAGYAEHIRMNFPEITLPEL